MPDQDAQSEVDQQFIDSIPASADQLDNVAGHRFVCEVCGLDLLLTDRIAFESGWDYPPFLGAWGIVSPRTCGNCGIEGTAWYALAVLGQNVKTVSDKHYATLERILIDEQRDHPDAASSTDGDPT